MPELTLKKSLTDAGQSKFHWPWSASLPTGHILTFFEGQVQSVVLVASFVPLVINATGNIGTQTAMIIARNFALGSDDVGFLRLRDYASNEVLKWVRESENSLFSYLKLSLSFLPVGFQEGSLQGQKNRLCFYPNSS